MYCRGGTNTSVLGEELGREMGRPIKCLGRAGGHRKNYVGHTHFKYVVFNIKLTQNPNFEIHRRPVTLNKNFL